MLFVTRLLARFVGLVFALLGLWILVGNLAVGGYRGAVLAWILSSGFLGFAGGVLYVLSFDGPARFRRRFVRGLGWAGMLALALLPTTLTIMLLILVLAAIPSLFVRPSTDEERGNAP
jgi:hypothetical protein